MHFLPYQVFKNGAQKGKKLTGQEALKRYLQQLGFPSLRICEILQQVETHSSPNVPNVMMNEYEYAVTYRSVILMASPERQIPATLAAQRTQIISSV